jgi:hypothetical protein
MREVRENKMLLAARGNRMEVNFKEFKGNVYFRLPVYKSQGKRIDEQKNGDRPGNNKVQ